MTISAYELGLYALGMVGLWLVPGPVWVALTARALSGGFQAAWPLALGVAMGDLLWPLAAILGLNWVHSVYGDILGLLRWAAAIIFVFMGIMLLRAPNDALTGDSRMTKPGLWAGFSVGVAAVVGNPKAILFYMGALPGFFDLSRVTAIDTSLIIAVSAGVTLGGNLVLAQFLGQARALLSSPSALRRMNIGSGVMLIGVGLVIPFI
jgi:threonine/homoserine/homoserine lactone efflux protein